MGSRVREQGAKNVQNHSAIGAPGPCQPASVVWQYTYYAARRGGLGGYVTFTTIKILEIRVVGFGV